MELKYTAGEWLTKAGVDNVVHTQTDDTHTYFEGSINGEKHEFSHDKDSGLYGRVLGAEDWHFMGYIS